jgi:hypothetical protein
MKKGEIYFIVMFSDGNLSIPVVQTLEFIETRVRSDGCRYALFRQYNSVEKESLFSVDSDKVDTLVLDKDQLMLVLARCFAGR